MESLNQESVAFEDVLCQMHDMIQPAQEGCFTLRDLKRNRALSGTLFNILFNLNKFVAFETRDPFLVRQVRRLGFWKERSCTQGGWGHFGYNSLQKTTEARKAGRAVLPGGLVILLVCFECS